MTERRHGYALYKAGACRCYVCAFAVSRYEENRKKRIAAGTWQPFVDLAPVRAHIEAHASAGVGTRRLAELAGVNRKTLQQAIHGRRGRPHAKMSRVVAEKVLAVPVASTGAAPHAVVDATGTRRRIQALCVLGWGFQAQGERAGWPRDRWHRVAREDRVLAETVELVRRVYDQLSGTPAPDSYGARRARTLARRQGWAPPLAWDDDRIDDPRARPKGAL